jgi:hypothetical protein
VASVPSAVRDAIEVIVLNALALVTVAAVCESASALSVCAASA